MFVDLIKAILRNIENYTLFTAKNLLLFHVTIAEINLSLIHFQYISQA